MPSMSWKLMGAATSHCSLGGAQSLPRNRECHHWRRSTECLRWQPMFHLEACQLCLVLFGQCPCPSCQDHPVPRKQIYCSPLAAGTCLSRKASEQPVSGVRRCVSEWGAGNEKRIG